MSEIRNYAMLGKWHVHAEGYAKELCGLPGCRVSKVWDASESAAKEWANQLQCESAAVEDILADKSVEGVIVCNATNEHTELILRACEAGKAVFTEKVLALTKSEALRVKDAVLQNHTRFAISFPHMSDPGVLFALSLVNSGKLGKINYARMRKAHDGATGNWLPAHFYDPVACGGGAMVDLGAHPMYLICALLGEPVSVQSAFTHITGKPVEDNAVSLLTFPSGAIGVAETGFVSTRYPLTLEIGGEEGNFLMRGGDVQYCCAETSNVWRAPDKLPDRLPSPLARWALANAPEDVDKGFGIDAAVRLSAVMEAAYAK